MGTAYPGGGLVALKGGRELRARLKAIKTVFKPVGREWADETVRLSKGSVRVRTGATQRSIRRRNASMKLATVYASAPALWLDQGTAPHSIEAKAGGFLRFNKGGQVIFAKRVRHPGQRATRFATRAAQQALRNRPILKTLIDLWNKAA